MHKSAVGDSSWKRNFVGKCDGKAITFKQLKLQENNVDEATPKANGSTAKISPPAVSDSDSDEETINSIINTIRQNNSEDFGYGYAQNVAEFSINGVVTEDNIPNYAIMKETEFILTNHALFAQRKTWTWRLYQNITVLHIQ